VLLEALPRTAHGKLDRAALPEPPVNLAIPGRKRQAARDPLELQLIRLWETLLGKHPISIQDNFFDLGGHSLLAVQLFDRIAKLTGKNLPLAVLFQSPTIEQLAAILRQENWTPSWKSIVPAQPGGTNPPLFLVPPGATTVLNFANLVRHLPAEQPIYGLQYVGMGEHEQPHEEVEEMAAYYVEQIVKFQPEGPYLIGGICFGAHVAFEIARQLESQGKSVALLVILDAGPPANGPTWHYPRRFTLDHFRTIVETCREEGLKSWLNRRLRYRVVRARKFLFREQQFFADILALHHKAYTTYQARPYNGPTLLIQSEEFSRIHYYYKRWATLATGVFEHAVIANSTHRSVLLHGADIQLTAQRLMKSVNQVIEQTR
ncbi:MAG: thioesterase domain-containing protein, partial [Chloroflexi bacterium]|nr:thioesterase domain-containing protein [Chloroflexota bacterium]